MGNQETSLGKDTATTNTAKMPGQVSHKRLSTRIDDIPIDPRLLEADQSATHEGQPLRDHKRPLEPPEIREVVVQKAKRARECIDLTADIDGQPSFKTRSIRPPQKGIFKTLTPQFKNESPDLDSLGVYSTYSTKSPQAYDFNGMSSKLFHAQGSDHFYQVGEEDAETDDTSKAHEIPKNMPFVDEGYGGSFTASQERNMNPLGLSEVDLASRLINSDQLRGIGDGLGVAYSASSKLKTPDQTTQNAIASKARIEREGAKKSKALREVARAQIGRAVEENHDFGSTALTAKRPEYTPQQAAILSMFDRVETISGRRGSNSSASADNHGGYTSTLSDVEYENEALYESDLDDGDQFGQSRDSRQFIDPSADTEKHIGIAATIEQPKSLQAATAYSWNSENRGRRTSTYDVLPPRNPSHRAWIEIRDLEADDQKLKDYIRLNDSQKPSTLFTPHHLLDKLGRSYLPKSKTGHSPRTCPKFYSPYGESVHRPSVLSQISEEASDEPRGYTTVPKQAGLVRAPNRSGQLAVLAQKAGVDDNASESSPSFAPIVGFQTEEQAETCTPISFSEFGVEDLLSRYKRPLIQEELDLIKRHEWLRKRQGNLEALRAAYLATARLSCIDGVTETMDDELNEMDEFKHIVLDQGKIDAKRRTRVVQIRQNMTRRQAEDVVDDDWADEKLNLGILIDRKSLQKMDDEIKAVTSEAKQLGAQRRDAHNKYRKKRPKKAVKVLKKKTVTHSAKGSELARPKMGTEEYRKSQQDAYWKSQGVREDALREQLDRFHQLEPATRTTHEGGPQAIEDDAQSEVSEEDDGFEMYANFGLCSQPAPKPLSTTTKVSLDEMQRLDETRKAQEALEPPQLPKATGTAKGSGQAPDAALAEKMRMRQLGIPGQKDVAVLSDSESETSEDSDNSEEQFVINYTVYGQYTGVPAFEDCAKYRFERYLNEENAAIRIGEIVVEFCNARNKEIETATAAGDERWLARLGKPKSGWLKIDFETGEQIMDYPGGPSCRIWKEMGRVKAKTRQERESIVPTTTYVALFERRLPDGSTDTASLDELVFCTGANGLWLANQEAARIMGVWYAEHLQDGNLAMYMDDLEEKVEALGEEGRFCEEIAFKEDRMKVYVEAKRNRA